MMFVSRIAVPLLTLAMALIFGATPTHASPGAELFPRDGRAAVHQRTLDLANHQAVMVVALQPGYEDLKLLSYLRAFEGVRTTVVYLTNGEATPGDTIGQYPVWMTGERKGEAHRVARFLDAGAWFMNLPDVPAPDRPSELGALWDSTGAQKRLIEVIRLVQPDAIVLSPDRRGNGQKMTSRDTLALSILTRAMASAATARDTSTVKGLLPWRTARLLTQRPNATTPVAYTAQHPVLRLSSLVIARQAAALYRTLRLQIGAWNDGALAAFPVTAGRIGTGIVTPAQIAAGIADPGTHLRTVAKEIQKAITTDRRGVRTAGLKQVTAAISATEQLIVYHVKELDRRERRIAIGWKEGLEDLRCTVRGLKIEVAARESLLTTNQVMFLDVTPDPSSKGKGQTVILFPLAANGEWTVNEKSGYFFNLDSAMRFNVLTPSEVQYTIPYSEAGLTQSRLDQSFPYVVVHKDSRREMSYMYHRDVRVQFGPRRTFALRTPLVFDSPTSPVIVELQNISRDKFAGELVLSDTTSDPSVAEVYFTKKDEKVLDTLFVPGPTPDTTDGRVLLLELSGRGAKRSVTTRAFRVAIDSTMHVGFFSTISGSPVEEALRVCAQPWKRLTLAEEIEGTDPSSVLLVDRGFLRDTLCTGALRSKLEAWVRKGGHAIMFPQDGAGAEWLRSLSGTTFTAIEPVPPGENVTSPWIGALNTPNALGATVWRDWVEARASFAITTARTDARTLMAARSGMLPLISTVSVGNGMVTLVAADLPSQFMNYHPGAHRILANLIALRLR